MEPWQQEHRAVSMALLKLILAVSQVGNVFFLFLIAHFNTVMTDSHNL